MNGKIMLLMLAALSCTAATLATSTYAWFLLSDNLIASNIRIDMESTTFKIGMRKSSAEKTTYDLDLSDAFLGEYSPSYAANKAHLSPVSGMYESLWNKGTYSVLGDASYDANLTPSFRDAYIAGSNTTSSQIAASQDYLQLEFYFLSNEDTYVFLDSTTSLTANTTVNAAVASAYGLTASDLNKVADCMRVSFYSSLGYTVYEPNVTTSSATPFGGRLNVDAQDDYFDTYTKSNQKYEQLYGEYNADAVLQYDESARVSTLSGTASCFNALSDPQAQCLNLAKSTSVGGLKIATEKSYTLSALEGPDNGTGSHWKEGLHPIAYCPAYEETRVVVSLYAEGWDRDAVDSINKSVYDLKLAFAGFFYSRTNLSSSASSNS